METDYCSSSASKGTPTHLETDDSDLRIVKNRTGTGK